MRKYYPLIIVVIVFLVGLIECHGQDSLYCLPIQQARKAAQYVIEKMHQDTTIKDLRSQLSKQKADYAALQRDYSEYRKNSERITETRQMLTDGLARQAEHWQKEAVRNDRKWKWGRWLIPAAFVVGVLVGK